MKTETFENDLVVLYVTASSFPEGIMDAHQQLRKLLPFSAKRSFFGFSRPEGGKIVYRAAAEEKEGDAPEKSGLGRQLLKKGQYITLLVKNYAQNIPAIDDAFKQLLSHPRIDPQGYCIEWYFNDQDVKCMVRLI